MSRLNPYLERHIGQHAALAGPSGLDGLRSLVAERPELSDRLGEALDSAAVEYRLTGQLNEAVAASEEAVEVLRPLAELGPEKQNLLLTALEGMTASYTAVGRLDDADRIMQELDRLRARLSARTTEASSRLSSFAIEISETSLRRVPSDRDRQLLTDASRRVTIYEKLVAVNPLHRPELSAALIDLAAALAAAGEPRASASSYRDRN